MLRKLDVLRGRLPEALSAFATLFTDGEGVWLGFSCVLDSSDDVFLADLASEFGGCTRKNEAHDRMMWFFPNTGDEVANNVANGGGVGVVGGDSLVKCDNCFGVSLDRLIPLVAKLLSELERVTGSLSASNSALSTLANTVVEQPQKIQQPQPQPQQLSDQSKVDSVVGEEVCWVDTVTSEGKPCQKCFLHQNLTPKGQPSDGFLALSEKVTKKYADGFFYWQILAPSPEPYVGRVKLSGSKK